jgi:hypothetical protein
VIQAEMKPHSVGQPWGEDICVAHFASSLSVAPSTIGATGLTLIIDALAEHFTGAVRNFETLEAAPGERDSAPHFGDAYRHVTRFSELIGALH